MEVPIAGTGKYLGEEELSKLGVLGDSAGQAHGDYVSKSLDLVDHRLCVGHLGPVLKLGLTVLANHPVNLLMEFGCGRRGNVLRYLGVSRRTVIQICTSMCDMGIDHSRQTLAINIVEDNVLFTWSQPVCGLTYIWLSTGAICPSVHTILVFHSQ